MVKTYTFTGFRITQITDGHAKGQSAGYSAYTWRATCWRHVDAPVCHNAHRARDSLRETLASIAPQLRLGDEHIVVGDGPQPAAAAICSEFVVSHHDGPISGSWGTAWRLRAREALPAATGCCSATMTTCSRRARWTLCGRGSGQPTTPHVFRMERTRWNDAVG